MLFKNVSEIKQYIPANAEFEFQNVSPYIQRQGEEILIRKYLGDTLYSNLDNAYKNNTLSPKMKELLDKVRMPLANYALLKYLPLSQINITKQGTRITSTDRDKPAFEWQVDKVRAACNEAVYEGIELLLLYLENNKSEPEFASWTTSSGYTQLSDRLIRNADEFDAIYSIGASRRTFHALRNCIREAEETRLLPLLGKDFIDELKSQLAANTLSANNNNAFNLACRTLAFSAIAIATARLPVYLSADGMQIISSSDRAAFNLLTPVELERVALVKSEAEVTAAARLQDLSNLLYDNPDNFLTWKSSSAFKPGFDNGLSSQGDQSVVAF